MTPDRLQFILDHCAGRQGVTAVGIKKYQNLVHFLQIEPVTLRNWLTGKEPIPRWAELLFEIHYAWPEVNSTSVQRLIDERDRPRAVGRRRAWT